MQQPGLTSPQGFNTAAVAAGPFALIFQRVGRVAFAVTDSTLAEDDGDEFTASALTNYGHAVIDDDAVTLVGGEHGVVLSITDEVDKLGFTGLCVYEAVHCDTTENLTAVTHQCIAHSLGGINKRACVKAHGGGNVYDHVVLLMVCIGSGHVVVVQAEGGTNQTALCLTLPEVIQTGCDRLQRVLAGQFDGQVSLGRSLRSGRRRGPSSHRSE
uniref:Structural protein n=1 Tax=Salmonella phage MB78 TaxID=52971 RepID=Q9T1D8_9CAUD|nr:structural protein [Salmonella phage MB78]